MRTSITTSITRHSTLFYFIGIFGLNIICLGHGPIGRRNQTFTSASSAIFATYNTFLSRHGHFMGLQPDFGGHLSHGYFHPTWPSQQRCQDKILAAHWFISRAYCILVNPATSLVKKTEYEQKNGYKHMTKEIKTLLA